MTNTETLLALHEEPREASTQMIYEIWDDGEVTLTKAGDLYGQRGLHMNLPACCPPIKANFPPNVWGTHGRIATIDREKAERARELVKLISAGQV